MECAATRSVLHAASPRTGGTTTVASRGTARQHEPPAPPPRRTVCVVTYYGCEREPLASAVDRLRTRHGWAVENCSLFRWRNDTHDQRLDYLCVAAETFGRPEMDVVLFWYHGLTHTELAYLRQRTPSRVRFCLFTWDDPFDWLSVHLNTCQSASVFDGGVVTCCDETRDAYRSVLPAHTAVRFCYPGYVETLAAEACRRWHGPDRFVCDVALLITNLYDDDVIYNRQRVPRRAFVDALCAVDGLTVHLYGPESLASRYGAHRYRGFASYEQTYELMRTARCVVSTHVVSVGVERYANERSVVALGCGALLLTDLVPEHSGALSLGDTVDSAVDAVQRAVALPYATSEALREASRAYARNHYEWSHWSDVVHEVLRSAVTTAAAAAASVRPTKETAHRSLRIVPTVHLPQHVSRHLQIRAPMWRHPWCPHTPPVAIRDWHEPWDTQDAFERVPPFETASPPILVDFAVSIGSWCLGAHLLRVAGLRRQSFPFDWAFSSLIDVLDSVREPWFVYDQFLTPDASKMRNWADAHEAGGRRWVPQSVVVPDTSGNGTGNGNGDGDGNDNGDGDELLCKDPPLPPFRVVHSTDGSAGGCQAHKMLGFPHHVPEKDMDGYKIRKACDAWNALLYGHGDDASACDADDHQDVVAQRQRSVLFVHVARPHESVHDVLAQLQEFVDLLRLHCPRVRPHVLSVWHQVSASAAAAAEAASASYTYVERSVHRTVVLFRTAHEWDGGNWKAPHESAALLGILSHFALRDPGRRTDDLSLPHTPKRIWKQPSHHDAAADPGAGADVTGPGL